MKSQIGRLKGHNKLKWGVGGVSVFNIMYKHEGWGWQ